MTDSLISRVNYEIKELFKAKQEASIRAMSGSPIEEIRFLAGEMKALLEVQDRIAILAREADLEDHL